MIDTKKLWSRCKELEQERSLYMRRWQDVVDYILPTHRDFTTKRQPGAEKSIFNWDATATISNEILASAFHDAMTNKSMPWYQHTFRDRKLAEKRVAKIWLEESQDIAQTAFNLSNFYPVIEVFWNTAPALGTAALFFEDDYGKFRFENVPLQEITFEENSHGIADVIYRRYQMRVDAILDQWGDVAKQSQKVQAAINKDRLYDKLEVLHYVAPRRNKPTFNPDHRYIQVYSLPDGIHLNEKNGKFDGFHEQPYMIFRWKKMPGECYGTGIGMMIMPDIKTLNATIEIKMEALPLQVNPPWKTTENNLISIGEDGVIKPGAIIYCRRTDHLERVNTTGGLNVSEIEEEKQRQKIRDSYFVNQLLLAPDRPEQTAYEIQQRQNIVYRLLSQNASRAEVEVLKPIVERGFGILFRSGQFPDLPEELQGQELDIEFVSPLARAQKFQEVQATLQISEYVGNLSSLIPEVRHTLKWRDIISTHAANIGAPSKLIRDEKEYNEIIQKENESQQLSTELQQAETAAGALQRFGRGMQSMKQ